MSINVVIRLLDFMLDFSAVKLGFYFVVGVFLGENNSNPSLTALPCISKDFKSMYTNA